jgi:uncharacterized phage protein gp47/JayE
MATIERSSIQDIINRISNDLILSVNAGQTDNNKKINPSIRNSFISGLVNSMGAGFDENNDLISQILKQLFVKTAQGEYLELWGNTYGITKKAAKKSTGFAIFTGTSGLDVPIDTTLTTADGLEYITKQQGTIINSTVAIASIVRLGTTATATTISNHNYATGQLITIAGADQLDYNIINQSISVISENQFTFVVNNNPVSPATTSGSIEAKATFTFVNIESLDYGAETNQVNGSELLLDTPIINIDDKAIVNFNGLTGGSDEEDDEELRIRILERTSNLTAPFTKVGIPIFIKNNTININKIWVKTATPKAGQVEIYFVKDNQVNILPSSQDLQDVKNLIVGQVAGVDGILPANMSDSSLFVLAPNIIDVNFNFTSISPNTQEMQEAITQSLQDFFNSDLVNLGQSVLKNEYESAIFNTIDNSGNSPIYSLSSPSSDIIINSGELARLGTINFA